MYSDTSINSDLLALFWPQLESLTQELYHRLSTVLALPSISKAVPEECCLKGGTMEDGGLSWSDQLSTHIEIIPPPCGSHILSRGFGWCSISRPSFIISVRLSGPKKSCLQIECHATPRTSLPTTPLAASCFLLWKIKSKTKPNKTTH